MWCRNDQGQSGFAKVVATGLLLHFYGPSVNDVMWHFQLSMWCFWCFVRRCCLICPSFSLFLFICEFFVPKQHVYTGWPQKVWNFVQLRMSLKCLADLSDFWYGSGVKLSDVFGTKCSWSVPKIRQLHACHLCKSFAKLVKIKSTDVLGTKHSWSVTKVIQISRGVESCVWFLAHSWDGRVCTVLKVFLVRRWEVVGLSTSSSTIIGGFEYQLRHYHVTVMGK